ncbi:tyrosine-type recombinase/integrase [Maridesulfovibrio frigidus]|uniref:tyrosine-type recombinase/integrase n=1 Tax=Maridesulfovibrio frigidus TaxID=340956 RepID=UPI0004E0B590|nr:site-specific integrase [Maridesulfovibrio frigidus]
MIRIKTRYIGVYHRESDTRRFRGKPDICYEITYKLKNRKKIWEKIGWKSEGFSAVMANNLRSERLVKIKTGTVSVIINITYAKAWQNYCDRHLTEGKSKATDIYRHNKHIENTLGHFRLDQITPDILQTFMNRLSDTLSPQSVKHVLAQVRRVINKAIKWGHWDGVNPVTRITMPTINNSRTRYFTPNEAAQVLEELQYRSPQTHSMATVSLHTGMRFGEIAAIRWADVNFDAGTISIFDAKTGDRHALMTDTVKKMLSDMPNKVPSDYLFFSRKGDKIKAASPTFERVVNELGLNADITDRRQKIVFHSLRHTYASWMATKGIPLYVIAELLGHSTLEMASRYAHLCPDQKREASNMVQEVFNSAGQ